MMQPFSGVEAPVTLLHQTQAHRLITRRRTSTVLNVLLQKLFCLLFNISFIDVLVCGGHLECEENRLLLGPIHTIPDSSYIRLIPISHRPSIHTIPDESDMLRIAFA